MLNYYDGLSSLGIQQNILLDASRKSRRLFFPGKFKFPFEYIFFVEISENIISWASWQLRYMIYLFVENSLEISDGKVYSLICNWPEKSICQKFVRNFWRILDELWIGFQNIKKIDQPYPLIIYWWFLGVYNLQNVWKHLKTHKFKIVRWNTINYLFKYISVNEKGYVYVDPSITRMYSFKIIEHYLPTYCLSLNICLGNF